MTEKPKRFSDRSLDERFNSEDEFSPTIGQAKALMHVLLLQPIPDDVETSCLEISLEGDPIEKVRTVIDSWNRIIKEGAEFGEGMKSFVVPNLVHALAMSEETEFPGAINDVRKINLEQAALRLVVESTDIGI